MRIPGLREVALPLGVALAIQATASTVSFTVPVMAPELAAGVGVPASWVGYFIAIVYLGASLNSAFAHVALDRLGAMTASLLAILLCGAGMLAVASGSLVALAAGAALLGMGYGLTNPAGTSILFDATPRAIRATVFSIKQTAVPLGGVVAGALVPWLLGIGGWRLAAAGVSGLCLAVALALTPLRRRLDKKEQPVGGSRPVAPLRLVLGHPDLRRLAAASFGLSAMQLSITTSLVTTLVVAAGLSLPQAGFLFALAQAASIVARLAWGAVADVLRSARLTLAGLAGAVTVLAWIAAFIQPDWSLLALALLCIGLGATGIAWNGIFMAEVVRVAPPGTAGAATAGTLTCTFAGVVVGPPLFSLTVYIAGAYGPAYAVASAFTLIATCLILKLR